VLDCPTPQSATLLSGLRPSAVTPQEKTRCRGTSVIRPLAIYHSPYRDPERIYTSPACCLVRAELSRVLLRTFALDSSADMARVAAFFRRPFPFLFVVPRFVPIFATAFLSSPPL
jgi:hypothetical protein